MAPLLHVVALKFSPVYSSERIIQHFEEEVALKRRMPNLVESWSYKRNLSLISRPDVNGGCGWVVLCNLYDESMLETYLVHPEHVEVGRIQNPMLEGKFVLDVHGRAE